MEKFRELKADKYLKWLPVNARIDKTYTGIGGTTAEQLAERDSIILMPAFSAVTDKTTTNSSLYLIEDVHGVYGGNNRYEDIVKYITNDSIKYKKLYVTMSDRSLQLIKDLANVFPEVYDYHLLLDEVDEISDNGTWRKALSKCYNLVSLWKRKSAEGSRGSVSVISATGINFIKHPTVKKLPLWKVPVQHNRNDFPVEVIESDDVGVTLVDLLSESSYDKNFIFYNTVRGLDKLINTLGDGEDSLIFCGRGSSKVAGSRFSRDFTRFAKYNFITSANFRSVNFNTSGRVFVVTDATSINARLSVNDIIQAIGRLRTNNKKITIIMKTKENKNNFEQSANEMVEFYRDLANQILGVAKAYEKTGDLTERFLDNHDEIIQDEGEFQINWAWIEGKVKERLEDKPAHESVEKFIHALKKYDIEATKGTSPKSTIKVIADGEECWGEVIDHVISVKESVNESKGLWISQWDENGVEGMISKGIDLLGVEVVRETTSKSDLKGKIAEFKTRNAKKNVGIAIANKLQAGVFYPSREVKQIIKEIYKLKGYSRTAKATDLKEFFTDVIFTRRRVGLDSKITRGVIVSQPKYNISVK